jgi:carbamate kinase
MMRVVAALGGNALLRRDEPADAETQRRNVTVAAAALARPARDHELIVTRGNGPQVGLLALRSEADRDVRPYPLDVLTAETEGMIGYLLEQGHRNGLTAREVLSGRLALAGRPIPTQQEGRSGHGQIAGQPLD